MQYVKVSDERITLFKDGLSSKIEEETGASIELNDTDRILKIEHEDSIKEMDISKVIKSISLGFDFSTSMQLINENLTRFETINIKKKTRNKKEFRRQKARIIGENGKAKRVVSDLTDAHIQVNGNKVGIIGDTSDAIKAREAIVKLLGGSPHAHVYEDLEKYQRKKNKTSIKDYSL